MDADGGKNDERHCSFCLQICSPAKFCSKCHKRAYCSRECQAIDWPSQGKGQGHKNWCRYECGEEDVDWHVVPVLGKGLGLVAKRTIPAGYRILVEPVFTDPKGHPGIQDLMPQNGTLEEKFALNATRPDSSGGQPIFDMIALTGCVSLRIARVNHNCDRNVTSVYCKNTRVRILVSLREIQAGEEICTSYTPIFNPAHTDVAEAIRYKKMLKDLLLTKHNITCGPDCVCNDSHVKKLTTKAFTLIKQLTDMEKACNVPTLQPAEDLLVVLNSIPLGQYSVMTASALYLIAHLTLIQLNPGGMFGRRRGQACKMSKAEKLVKLGRASECISMSHAINFAINPFSDETKIAMDHMIAIKEVMTEIISS